MPVLEYYECQYQVLKYSQSHTPHANQLVTQVCQWQCSSAAMYSSKKKKNYVQTLAQPQGELQILHSTSMAQTPAAGRNTVSVELDDLDEHGNEFQLEHALRPLVRSPVNRVQDLSPFKLGRVASTGGLNILKSIVMPTLDVVRARLHAYCTDYTQTASSPALCCMVRSILSEPPPW